ncbi:MULTISPECIES: hypothetical protein [Flavobacteriaceae]|jgi:hypothetical protein|uniref:HYC_CC_PP family protein n=1 Tax=Flavobacteriaceae TaxID=49546 RepID=UPI0005CA075E|nr:MULTISPECIES: hypothetical protein [Flavobacteriaceae]|tara:strand:- start:6323 stop:6736 length:414 start_codon:yes stop_codon:yes gene_type:complete
MKQAFYKISSFLMAIVVLFSTLSFTVDMHYCGDTLVDTSIFHKTKGCGMEMQNPSTEDCSVKVKDCCSDEQLVVQGQDDLKLSFDKLTFDQQLFVASFVYTYINLFEGLEENVTSYRDYVPPLVIRQIYKLDESYLI